MKKSARVSKKLLNPGLPGLQLATGRLYIENMEMSATITLGADRSLINCFASTTQ